MWRLRQSPSLPYADSLTTSVTDIQLMHAMSVYPMNLVVQFTSWSLVMCTFSHNQKLAIMWLIQTRTRSVASFDYWGLRIQWRLRSVILHLTSSRLEMPRYVPGTPSMWLFFFHYGLVLVTTCRLAGPCQRFLSNMLLDLEIPLNVDDNIRVCLSSVKRFKYIDSNNNIYDSAYIVLQHQDCLPTPLLGSCLLSWPDLSPFVFIHIPCRIFAILTIIPSVTTTHIIREMIWICSSPLKPAHQ